MIMTADKENKIDMMKYSFVMVGIWWIVFSQYTYFYLPKGNANQQKVTRSVIFNGFRELRNVWNKLQTEVPLKRYLLSFFVFSMAGCAIVFPDHFRTGQSTAHGSNHG